MRTIRYPRIMGCRASALLQATIAIMVIGSMASLAVDVGVWTTAKLELQRAADAAALAAAAEVDAGGTPAAASAQAIIYAQANSVAADPIASPAVCVTFGGYANNAFVPNATPVTAVRVRLQRSAAKGNAIRLFFGGFVGVNSVDVGATAVVRIQDPPAYNLVGIDWANFGSLGVLAKVNGRIVSNGDVNVGNPLGLLVGVTGDARSWGGQTKKGSLAAISGSVTSLPDKLQFASVLAPSVNDNARLGGVIDSGNDVKIVAAANIPAGIYVVHDLTLLAGVAVRLQGPVTFYVTGTFNLGASANLLGDPNFDPSNFKVRVLSGGQVNFLAPILTPLNLDLYAPDSPIVIAVGIGAFNGRLVGKSLDIVLPAAGSFTEDQGLDDPLPSIRRLNLKAR